MVNYSKWDNFADSSDEEEQQPKEMPPGQFIEGEQKFSKDAGEEKIAQVEAGFIIKTRTVAEGINFYINVCGSDEASGDMRVNKMTGVGIEASYAYVCGNLREDEDSSGKCLVVEVLFSKDTMKRCLFEKPTQEGAITTARAVVSQKLKALEGAWSLFEPPECREANGMYFFSPGRLMKSGAE